MARRFAAYLAVAIAAGVFGYLPLILNHPRYSFGTLPVMALVWAAEMQVWRSGLGGAGRAAASRDSESPGIGVGGHAFLDRLDASLGLPDSVRAEIRTELADHIADSVASLEHEGLSPDAAERESLARLGRPEELARQLRAAHQTRRRLFAGAAGGVWSAGSGIVQGYFVVFGLFVGCLVVATILWQKSASSVTDFWQGSHFAVDSSLGTATFAALSWLPAYLAGRRAVETFSRLSRRPSRRIGRLVTLAISAMAMWGIVFQLAFLQGWVSVFALVGVPVAFLAGSWTQERVRWTLRPNLRSSAFVATGVLVAGLALGAPVPSDLITGSGSHSVPDYSRIGQVATIPCPATPLQATEVVGNGQCAAINGTEYGFGNQTYQRAALELAFPEAMGRFQDIRFEVWRADAADATEWPFALDPTRSNPVLTGPVTQTVNAISFSFDLSHYRWNRWLVAVTAVGPDDRRYLLDRPISLETRFSGTVWDWLTARD